MSTQPNFPTPYDPPLPDVLHPLNPRHYWLLFKWIYLQPSRLKQYLYRAGADLYRAMGRPMLRRTLSIPAYRSLYVMAILLTTLLSLGILAIVSLVQGSSFSGWMWVSGVASGVIGGLAAGWSAGAGVTVAYGVALGVTGGAALGVSFGVTGGVSSGTFSVADGIAFGLTFGLAVGTTFSASAGMAGGIVVGLGIGVIGAITSAIIGGITGDIASRVAAGVALLVGGSRALFYLVEWPLAWRRSRPSRAPWASLERHPVLRDELTAWPLPGVVRLLRTGFETDLDATLRPAIQIAANPFQRWAVQRALYDFLAGQSNPLGELYHLINQPLLDDYLVTPVTRYQFREYPSGREALLGQVGQVFTDGTGGESTNWERIAWRLTRRWRRMEPTPLARFSAMLYELVRDEAQLASQDAREINLERFAAAYEDVRPFPHGAEVADSIAAIAAFLKVSDVTAIATAHRALAWVDRLAEPLLRPRVIETLRALNDVSQDVAAFQQATNTGQQAAALNRAAGALNELAAYIQAQPLPPERVLLARVVEHWAFLVAAEQGKLGAAALRDMSPAARRAAGVSERTSTVWQRPTMPLDNPYVVGDPVYPPLLVGRKDVFDRIGEVWSAKANPDSIILYGHRRMGKSSILRNLTQVAPEGSLIVYADMAGETSFVASTADLLLGLADRIHAALRRARPAADLPAPDPPAYDTPARAQFQFNRLLENVRDALAGGVLILALDEFEAVERAVERSKIGVEIYQFLRTKTQEPWITLVFGGLHTLDEMSRDYQQPFYGSYENIRVSYLTHQAAWRLITNPGEGFDLNYEPEAVERIIAATGGQPYLVQQVCRDALDHLNHELFDLELARDVLIQRSDVEAVLGEDFFRRGTVYFDGVWTQAQDPAQRALLRTMAARDEPWTLDELKTRVDLEREHLRRQLRWAERHDVLFKTPSEPPAWGFHVPLMRQWIRTRE